jgi:hypothetical protein
MKRILIAILIFTSSFTYGQHPYKVDLNHIATITFPDTAKLEPNNDGVIYGVKLNNNIYTAGANVVYKGVVNSFKKHFEDSLYAQLIDGVLSGTKGKLQYKKNIQIQGISGIDFFYTAAINGVEYNVYNQSFYLNNILILYTCWVPAPITADDKNLKAFFNSFKLTIANEDVRQNNATEIGYIIGYTIGILAVIAVFVSMGFGIVYIIKKVTYK